MKELAGRIYTFLNATTCIYQTAISDQTPDRFCISHPHIKRNASQRRRFVFQLLDIKRDFEWCMHIDASTIRLYLNQELFTLTISARNRRQFRQREHIRARVIPLLGLCAYSLCASLPTQCLVYYYADKRESCRNSLTCLISLGKWKTSSRWSSLGLQPWNVHEERKDRTWMKETQLNLLFNALLIAILCVCEYETKKSLRVA